MKRIQKSKGKAVATFFAILLGALCALYVGVSIGSGTWNPGEWIPPADEQVEQLPEENPDETPDEEQTPDAGDETN